MNWRRNGAFSGKHKVGFVSEDREGLWTGVLRIAKPFQRAEMLGGFLQRDDAVQWVEDQWSQFLEEAQLKEMG